MAPVKFNNDDSLHLDYEVEIQLFYIIVLMMIHDGYHDFYNDKSKEAFKKLFLKYGKILKEYAEFLKENLPSAAAPTTSVPMDAQGGAAASTKRSRGARGPTHPSKVRRAWGPSPGSGVDTSSTVPGKGVTRKREGVGEGQTGPKKSRGLELRLENYEDLKNQWPNNQYPNNQ